MKQPPARELLSSYLRKRQDSVLRRLLMLIDESPDLVEVQELAHTRDYQQAMSNLLNLLVQNIADPSDRRCFHYVRQRAMLRFRENIHATQMLRIVTLHRQVVTKMLQRQFADDPALTRRMAEILEEQLSEVEMAITDAYQAERDRQWQISETKYFSLFQNASEAIISFRPGEGRVVEANAQAERLLGRPRLDILGATFSDLFPAEHHEQARWLINQPGTSSNLRLEDMAVRHANGMIVPISLSCNWVNADGAAVAHVIMRDVTQLRQVQRELQNHAEQLEERVGARTHELQQSEERYRALFLQEQRRAQHLALINGVQQCALATRDVDEFLHQVAAAIQGHFRECDVTFFLCHGVHQDIMRGAGVASSPIPLSPQTNGSQTANSHHLQSCGSSSDMVAVADAGGHGLSLPVGGRHPFGAGLPGYAATHGELFYIANDTSRDTRYARPPGVHRDARSELCVPVLLEGETIGVIAVQCEALDAFDEHDAAALQTAATIVAAHIQACRMFLETRELKEFNETLVTTMLHSLMVVNRDGLIQIVNDRLCRTLRLRREDLISQPLSRVFSEAVIHKNRLLDVLREVTDTGIARELQEVRIWVSEADLIFDLRMSRVYFRGEARVVLLLFNITQRWRQTQQLQWMNEMGRLLQTSLDMDKVLHTVLTYITAGPALGFNRAFVLLYDEDNDTLQGTMALGPSSHDEANRIWRELGQRQLSLQELIANETALNPAHPTTLQKRTLELTIDLENPHFAVLARAARERHTLLVDRDELIAPGAALDGASAGSDAKTRPATRQAMMELFTANKIAIAPLVAKDDIVGLVLADNLYSAGPIDENCLRLLDTVAQQAGLAIDNAQAYHELQKAQRELVAAERLAAVGEMAARVSHEIRNPLATIGGFARNILKRPQASPVVQEKIGIIVDEVARLEALLSDLLDMTRPSQPDLQLQGINEIMERALLLANADIKAANVEVRKDLAADLPAVPVDRRRLLQALLNTVRNGAQAMPDGGILHVATSLTHDTSGSPWLEIRVADSGMGIPERALKQVFDPFFTTKIRGSGLGLAITQHIIRDHGGSIDVQSIEGKGTTFIFKLPVPSAEASAEAPAEASAEAVAEAVETKIMQTVEAGAVQA